MPWPFLWSMAGRCWSAPPGDPRGLPARRAASVLYLRPISGGDCGRGSVGHVSGMAQAFQREGQSVSFPAADLPAGIDREAMAVHWSCRWFSCASRAARR